MCCQNVDMRHIWRQCRSECMCECGNCASISPTRVRSGWKYRSIPPTRDRKICDCENLHLKKKKKKKGCRVCRNLHQERELTTWEFTLDGTTCYQRNYVMENATWINFHHHYHHPCMIIYAKKTNQRNIRYEKVLKSIQIRFRQVNLKKLTHHQFIYPLCKRRFFTVLV